MSVTIDIPTGTCSATVAGQTYRSAIMDVRISTDPAARMSVAHIDSASVHLPEDQAEHLIAQKAVSFAILRPGFVWAPAAYGGSALIRALAAVKAVETRRECREKSEATGIHDTATAIAASAPAQNPAQDLPAVVSGSSGRENSHQAR